MNWIKFREDRTIAKV